MSVTPTSLLNKGLFSSGDTILVAISGGLDSVVLAHALAATGQQVVLAHCNFGLRGADSDADEAFVRTFARMLGAALHVKRFETGAYAAEKGVGIQVAARQLRYDWFESLRTALRTAHGTVWIATAHHANDVAETMLMHLFRGTGIDGLRGIPEKNGAIIRPMLAVPRETIQAYAQANCLSWVEDASNAESKYTRNFVRNEIMPLAAQHFDSLTERMYATAVKLREAAVFYHEAVQARLRKMVVAEGETCKVPVNKLLALPERNTLIWEWVKPLGATEGQAGEVARLLHAANGSYVAWNGYRIIRNRAWLVLVPISPTHENPPVVADKLPFRVTLANGYTLTLDAVKPRDADAPVPVLPAQEALIDAGLLQFPLIIRPWKEGDYFYPLGMPRKKKIARFLIDRKLPPHEKAGVWVIESQQRMVWIIGHRIDHRFRVTEKTVQTCRMAIG